ncbi:MAG: hypothetical protein WA231_25175 [Methylocella sp.]
MGEAKRRKQTTRNKIAEGTHAFSNDAEAFDLMAKHLLEKSDDLNVIIGPAVHPPIGQDGPDYFIVATSEKNRGFRCDQISVGEGYNRETMRAGLVMALIRRKPIVIHDTDDELYMAKLCEMLWPGKRITRLREAVEAERAVKH